jgi:hypothetical protein
MVGQDENQHDYFPADRAWLYVTLLTIGYMISRGLPKAAATPSTTPDLIASPPPMASAPRR